jgi:3-oxoacyl-[acyl-carrier protein] reductase
MKEDFLHIYGTNVVGPYQMIRAAAPHLKKTGKASVVNIASIAGVTGTGSSVAYCASKAALINMTICLARVLGPEIRVNAICPGFIQGEWLQEGMGKEIYELYMGHLDNTLPRRKTAITVMIVTRCVTSSKTPSSSRGKPCSSTRVITWGAVRP